MNKLIRNFLFLSNIAGAFFCLYNSFDPAAMAQVNPDGTTSTTVENDGSNFTINDGDIAGDNLFHSFQDFSVPNGGSAIFNNSDSITNIFSRVTGGNISNINGLIGANGTANLFLINPAGILLGENASLSIGGSFYGTTADSILFEDGEFQAFDGDNPPLLTVNAPIGLNFRNEPADIGLQGTNITLQPTQTLAFIGGNIDLQGAGLGSSQGQILLGGLNEAGTVTLDENLNFAVPENINRGNISINSALINAISDRGGTISFQGKNITVANSSIFTGIFTNLGTIESEGGIIEFDATESLTLTDNSRIDASNFGAGNAGNIVIDARDSVTIDNQTELLVVSASGQGRAGNVNITTNIFELNDATESLPTNSSRINAGNFGTGNAGNIVIDARDSVTIDNKTGLFVGSTSGQGRAGNIDITTDLLEINNQSRISAIARAAGDAGDINIEARSISLNNIGLIRNDTLGVGNAGNINIQTQSLAVNDGSGILSTTEGEGNAGNIQVNASNSVTVSGVAPVKEFVTPNNNSFPGGFSSGLLSSSEAGASGSGGTVSVTTDKLSISDGAVLSGRTKSAAPGGNIIVNADTIDLSGGGQILTAAFDEGNAGNITLNVADSINISGSDPTFFTRREQVIELANQINTGQLNDLEQAIDPVSAESGIFASTGSDSTGSAGSISIAGSNSELPELSLANNGRIAVDSRGQGNGGNIFIQGSSLDLNNAAISAETPQGTGGNIDLDIENNLTLREESLISAAATNDADGGNIQIDSEFLVALPNGNSDIIATAQQGDGGRINITAEALFGIEERPLNPITNDINASSRFGLDGNISIFSPDVNTVEPDSELSENLVKETQTVTEACRNRNLAGTSGLTIIRESNVLTEPGSPLDSDNIIASDRANPTSTTPQPVETARGKIQPARGAIINDSGEVVLTAYRTDNLGNVAGQRRPENKRNCGRI